MFPSWGSAMNAYKSAKKFYNSDDFAGGRQQLDTIGHSLVNRYGGDKLKKAVAVADKMHLTPDSHHLLLSEVDHSGVQEQLLE